MVAAMGAVSANFLRHRASNVETQMKIQKLREFIDPVKAQWQNENIRESLKSYSGFCEQLALNKAQTYLVGRRAHEVKDWGSQELDAEGLALQTELEDRIKVSKQSTKYLSFTLTWLKILTLRATKSFLAFSVERLDKTSPAFQASYTLWQDGFSDILADLLQLLRYVTIGGL